MEPAELRFNTEMTAVRQDEGGVTAALTDGIGGGETEIRAQYLIAADGAQSRVRRVVASRMIGEAGGTPLRGLPRRRGPRWLRLRLATAESFLDPDGACLAAYKVEPDGAVLVRPAGYVCWRSRTHVAEPVRAASRARRHSRPRLAGHRLGSLSSSRTDW